MIKRMLEYWDPDKILREDEEITVLGGLHGAQKYSYFISLKKANVEMELHLETLNRELLNDRAVRKLEKHLFKALEEMQKELTNDEPLPQKWSKSR